MSRRAAAGAASAGAALAAESAGAAGAADAGVEARLYRSIFESVMQQRLAPGTKLPESQLCEIFGVSRSVARKVLQRLAHDHIVELRPHRGASVAVPTAEDTRQIFEARHVVEAATVRLAAQHASAADVAALRRQLAEEHEAMHRFDQPAWTRLASAFHLRVAALSRNPILQRYLEEIVSRCSLIVALYEPPGNAACEHDEHERIVDCIARRDDNNTTTLITKHLRILERNVVLRRESPDRSLRAMLGMNR